MPAERVLGGIAAQKGKKHMNKKRQPKKAAPPPPPREEDEEEDEETESDVEDLSLEPASGGGQVAQRPYEHADDIESVFSIPREDFLISPEESPFGPNGMQKAGTKKSGEGLSIKLELNLEIELQIKAKIHGDLTLSLLA